MTFTRRDHTDESSGPRWHDIALGAVAIIGALLTVLVSLAMYQAQQIAESTAEAAKIGMENQRVLAETTARLEERTRAYDLAFARQDRTNEHVLAALQQLNEKLDREIQNHNGRTE